MNPSLIFRHSSSGMTYIQIAIIMKRLKAADPTMVEGPKSPAFISLPKVSTTERRISGADEPKAMRVKLETVSFQIRTEIVLVSPLEL